MKPISNKKAYPDAIWIDPKLIGDVAGMPLYLVGYEFEQADNPKNYPLVAIDRPGVPTLFADSLSEMAGHLQDPITITESLK